MALPGRRLEARRGPVTRFWFPATTGLARELIRLSPGPLLAG
jgi:hypothetical protein